VVTVGSDFYIGFNDKQIKLDIDQVRQGLDAAAKTVMRPPIGKVVVSARKKMKHEKKRAVHGKAIANFMRTQGKDPFATDSDVISDVTEEFNDNVQIAIETAYSIRKQQKALIRIAVIQAARLLAAAAKEKIITGGLGEKKTPSGKKRQSFFALMRWRINTGRSTGRYGFPIPYGIDTGRFVEGIRALPRK
jgi:hypothetical protein